MELQIEKMTEQDFDTLFKWYLDPAYESFFRHMPQGLTRDNLALIMSLTGVTVKASTPKVPMAVVGFIMVFPKTNIADIGIITNKICRRQGLASTFTKQLIDHIFTEGTVNRIVMQASDPNIIAALKRGGFFEECRMYKNCFYNGKLHNESRMIMTKDFYNKCKERK